VNKKLLFVSCCSDLFILNDDFGRGNTTKLTMLVSKQFAELRTYLSKNI
jgi:hypothetical protein